MSSNLESDRIWHGPVVEIYGNLITPGVRCAGEAYDLGNRRWYQLQVDSVIADDNWDWMSNTVAHHIREYYKVHGVPPHWNTIRTTSSGSPVSYETQPYDLVERPITEKFHYGDQPGDKLRLTSFAQVKEKYYLSRAADYCRWNDTKCVFKRIEFNVDVRSFKREIQTRETLMARLGNGDFDTLQRGMLDRFKVVPILAVVTDGSGPGMSGNVLGFIMPFLGNSLEMLEEQSSSQLLGLEEGQLRKLTEGVLELSQCGVIHGDIRFWNVVLGQPPLYNADDGEPRLFLIDLGNIAPDYQGDAIALGMFIDWCLEHSPRLGEDAAVATRVRNASNLLKSEKIEEALSVLNEH